MEIRTTKCDRCGEIITDSWRSGSLEIPIEPVKNPFHFPCWRDYHKCVRFDLCKKCSHAVHEFIWIDHD